MKSLEKYEKVSVPYRGATFLNNVKPTAWELVNKFPSPIGELHFSMGNKIISTSLWNTVSVPYRGATFLNSTVSSRSVDSSAVSVPYRGATFLNSSGTPPTSILWIEFPSPIGELHFSMIISSTISSVVIAFPSPIGELHFSIVFICLTVVAVVFPSPIGELHFSIPSPQPHVLSGTNRGIAGEK